MDNTLVHGGDWAGFEAEYGTLPLDFSSNVSPLGLPPRVQKAIEQYLPSTGRYPDPLCRQLRQAIAAAEQVDPDWCLCGCGAAGLIYQAVLAKHPGKSLLTAPTFAEYEAALALVGSKTAYWTLRPEDGFLLDEQFLHMVTPEVEMVFLCQPNNPTGRTVSQEFLLRLLSRCQAVGALLVVDECFCDFLEDPAAVTMKGFLREYGNLLILKAFTKLYAMAGLRLGYALCSDTALLAAMGRAGPPWAVSGPAQAAGAAALQETQYVNAVRELTARERPLLSGALERLGFQVVPGEANYLLFFSRTPLLEPLRRRGILLRDCSNYRGLKEGCYRTAVRTHSDNQRLIAALEEILKEEST